MSVEGLVCECEDLGCECGGEAQQVREERTVRKVLRLSFR